ncbi:MAG TPA: Crp/Fnr family transcriptional regulator [Nitrospira sp.]|nr:Crp/Fnr family transcriptional regulator [Nitrospira sp.]
MSTVRRAPQLDPKTFLAQADSRTTLQCEKHQLLFSQGEAADAVFYIQAGKVKLTVASQEGKEAVITILEGGAFLGESCLAGQTVRAETATAMEDSALLRIGKDAMIRVLDKEPGFAKLFMSHLLAYNIRIQADLVDQLFNCSEKRLARILLLLAHFENEAKPEAVIPKISQETLAEMVGTTRSRVSFFMNKFRKLGFIDYKRELLVRSSLLNVVLHDEVPLQGSPDSVRLISSTARAKRPAKVIFHD